MITNTNSFSYTSDIVCLLTLYIVHCLQYRFAKKNHDNNKRIRITRRYQYE